MLPDRSQWVICSAETEEQVIQAYAFAVSVLGSVDQTIHTLPYYLDHFQRTPGLLVYAERQGQVAGSIFGSIDGDHVLVGMVAVDPSARRQGVGMAMMKRLEEEAVRLGQTTLLLGALQEAENFYLRCGFRPNLFIQLPGIGRLADLKQLNEQYPVIWEAEADGWTKLMLATPQVDRQLQDRYERQFPGCATQYVFIKDLK